MSDVPILSPRVRPPMWPIYLCVAVTAIGIGLVNPLIPRLLQERGASEFVVGLTTSVMFASLVLTAWPIGRKIDRVGVRPLLIFGLVCYSIALLLMPWLRRVGPFFLLRMLEGVGWSAVWTSAETYVSKASDADKRGHNMALYGMAVAGGTAAGPLVGAGLWSIWEPLPFITAVVLAVAAGVLVTIILPELRLLPEDHAPISGISFSLARPLTLPLIIAFLYGYGTLSLVALVPTLNYSTFQISLLITITVAANIVAQVPVGRLMDRFGYRPVLLSSLTLLSGAALLATLHPPFPLLLLLGSLLGAFAGTLYPIGLAILGGRVPPSKLGGANGLFTVCYGLGSVFGPSLTGLVMSLVGERHSDQALFATIGILVLGLLVLMLFGIDRVGVDSDQVAAQQTSSSFKPPL